MITHTALREACIELGLDPDARGKAFVADARPVQCLDQPYNLRKINFPKKELKEVSEIGTLINNLCSQVTFPKFYDYNRGGREASERDYKIEKFLPTAIDCQKYWFEKGLKGASPKKKEFELYYGRVFQINPQYYKNMQEMNERMKVIKRESKWKSAMSEISASKVVFTV